MKFKDWLEVTDIIGLKVIIWTEEQLDCEEDEPLWEGSSLDIPWYIANMKISKKKWDGESSISYRPSLGEDKGNKPGFVVTLKD